MEGASEILVIGVCTFKRPNMLSRLFEACSRLEPVPNLDWALLIVDNDAEGSARPAVEGASHSLPMPVHYVIEAERGIARARNRVLAEALRLNADYLALIDDDEIMRPDWLLVLFGRMAETGADAVGSDVFWDLPGNAPAWAHALPTSPLYEQRYGRFNKKQKPRIYPSTNNVLMKARIFRDLGLRFDVRFGWSGGEDTDFFRRAKEAGARFAFTEKAAALETVPPSRLTLRWRFWRWAGVARGNVRMHRLQHGRISAWRHYLPRSL